MQVLDLIGIKKNYKFKWPGGDVSVFPNVIVYRAQSESGLHEVMIGYGKRTAYGKKRRRVVLWIDDRPSAEFCAADDFDKTGEILSEIRFYDDKNESTRMCKYAEDAIPQRYCMFRVDSMKRRVSGPGVHDAWAIVANASDHATIIALGSMRKYEKED